MNTNRVKIKENWVTLRACIWPISRNPGDTHFWLPHLWQNFTKVSLYLDIWNFPEASQKTWWSKCRIHSTKGSVYFSQSREFHKKVLFFIGRPWKKYCLKYIKTHRTLDRKHLSLITFCFVSILQQPVSLRNWFLFPSCWAGGEYFALVKQWEQLHVFW